MKEILLYYSKTYHHLMDHPEEARNVEMPGKAFFIGDNAILALPRDDGDSRYPYGKNGFNFWTYASGYMHSNEGLFSPFLRAGEGSEPKIAFFAGTRGTKGMFPLLSVPILDCEEDSIVRYTVFTAYATYYITEVEDVMFGIRTFVDEKNSIHFTLEIVSLTDTPQSLTLSTYFNPFIRNALVENSTDRWFRKAEYIEDDMIGTFVIETYEERERLGMAANYGVMNRRLTPSEALQDIQITTSRYDYVGGTRSMLATSRALMNRELPREKAVTSFTETAICADMLQLEVTDHVRMDICFDYTFDDFKVNDLKQLIIDPNQVDEKLQTLRKLETARNSSIALHFEGDTERSKALNLKSEVFNGFNEHLKKQVEFCSVIKGYIQLSSFSLIGIRDVFQAIEGLLFYQPDVARAKMLEAFDFTHPNGRLPRQYSLPVNEEASPAMDLRPFIDQGAWVISTVATYLKQTKDYGFLEEICGYYDIVDEHKHMVRRSKQKDSVLDHLLKVMNYLIENRDHEKSKCVLALYGDWNDALDGLGKSKDPDKAYGTGVSVMATLQTYLNLEEMIQVLNHVNCIKYESDIERYKAVKEEIASGLIRYALTDDRILHGWGDMMSYFVGSTCDPDNQSRDGITSNAFWILSGMYRDFLNSKWVEQDMKSLILSAYDRLGSKYGMKTFEPYFEKGTEGVGRIPDIPKGTAENGATYIHANMFAVMSLFMIGESERAYEELGKILPFTHETISLSPFVVPNSYGYNEELGIDGESMNDWQTGSSNVLLKLLIRFVFGFEPDYEGFYIQPNKYQPFERFSFTINYLNRGVRLHYKTDGNDNRTFVVMGEEYQGDYDPVMNLNRLYISDERILAMEEGDNLDIVIIDPME